MFFIGKRTTIALVLCYFSTLVGIAQENPPQKNSSIVTHQPLVLKDKIVHLSIFDTQVIEVHEVEDEAMSLQSDIHEACSHHWDTQAFDPYIEDQTPTNFEVHFKEEHFAPPVNHDMYITSRYGWRRGRAHKGIDIDLETGDVVNTILDGKVRYVGRRGGYGRIVVVRHYNGLETLYAHLSEYLVAENEIVTKGQAIGKGGVSGNSRGSHLHMEVRYHGHCIHPEYLFDFEDEAKVRATSSIVTSKWMNPRKHSSRRKATINVVTEVHDHSSEVTVADDKKESDNFYIVKKGDTLYGIAHRYHMEVSELCHKNEIQDNAILNIGQKILLN